MSPNEEQEWNDDREFFFEREIIYYVNELLFHSGADAITLPMEYKKVKYEISVKPIET